MLPHDSSPSDAKMIRSSGRHICASLSHQSAVRLHKGKAVALNIMWTHLYSVCRSWNCTCSAAYSLWRLISTLRRCCTWNAEFQFFLAEKHKHNESLARIHLSEWRGPVKEGLEEFIRLQWHGCLEGRGGSSYPVSKSRPVSPWTSRRPQTQHKWGDGLCSGTQCHWLLFSMDLLCPRPQIAKATTVSS